MYGQDFKDCSFWFDDWTPFGQLLSFIGQDGPRIYGIPIDSKVSFAATRNGWNFRGARSDNAVLLLCHLTSVHLNSEIKDRYKWKGGNGPNKDDFKFKIARRQTNAPFSEVLWHKQVWFSGHVPKHAFILWLACLDRLSTSDRLVRWGCIDTSTCVLCEIWDETREHFFLRCPYSQDVWRLGFDRLNAPFMGFGTWPVFQRWLKRAYPNAAENNLRLLMAQAIVYHLWKQRNDRIFNNLSLPAEVFFKKVDIVIRDSCLARKDMPCFQDSLALWFRST